MNKTREALERFVAVLTSLECLCEDGFTCSIHSDKLLVSLAIKEIDKEEVEGDHFEEVLGVVVCEWKRGSGLNFDYYEMSCGATIRTDSKINNKVTPCGNCGKPIKVISDG